MKGDYLFATSINKGLSGIIKATNPPEIICFCSEEKSKLIISALELIDQEPSSGAEVEPKENETILVDDPHYPNLGRRISKKEYNVQFASEQRPVKLKTKTFILDNHQNKIYDLSECDNEMLEHFPNRYMEVKLSDYLQNINQSEQRQVTEVSDEEIDKYIIEAISFTGLDEESFMKGAEWMRDKLTKQ